MKHHPHLLLLISISISASGQFCSKDSQLQHQNALSNLYRNHLAFSILMMDVLQKHTPTENAFFSPYSMYKTLLLVYFGAENVTERELLNVLDLNWAKSKQDVYSAYIEEKQLRELRSRKTSLQFTAGETIFVSKDIELEACASALLDKEIVAMNFRDDPIQSRSFIKSWLVNRTQNELQELFDADDITTETELLLANVAEFKILWDDQFDPNKTKTTIFYSTIEKAFLVPMMYKSGSFDFSIDQTLEAYVIVIPYANSRETEQNSDISMILLLPPYVRNGLDIVLSRLTAETLNHALRESLPTEINIALPKFTLEKKQNLEPILRNIGVKSMFEENADLNSFSKSRKLKFNKFKHASKITMNERGTTPLAPPVSFRLPSDPREVTFNHPFLFLIYDKSTSVVLFAGVVRNPVAT